MVPVLLNDNQINFPLSFYFFVFTSVPWIEANFQSAFSLVVYAVVVKIKAE